MVQRQRAAVLKLGFSCNAQATWDKFSVCERKQRAYKVSTSRLSVPTCSLPACRSC